MDKSSRRFSAGIYYAEQAGSAIMQAVAEINGQAICEKVLAADSRVKYTSYISSDGSTLGEAMNESIVNLEKLTVMVLPLHPRFDVLVLAASPNCNLREVISQAKLALN
jgi:hypothetical protein